MKEGDYFCMIVSGKRVSRVCSVSIIAGSEGGAKAPSDLPHDLRNIFQAALQSVSDLLQASHHQSRTITCNGQIFASMYSSCVCVCPPARSPKTTVQQQRGDKLSEAC